MMTIEKIVRVFDFKGTQLPDPNPAATPDAVRDILSTAHPELATAAVEGPVVKGGKHVFTFITSVGTKG